MSRGLRMSLPEDCQGSTGQTKVSTETSVNLAPQRRPQEIPESMLSGHTNVHS